MTTPEHDAVDLDALLDLSEYDNNSTYDSISMSPVSSSKSGFTTPRPVETALYVTSSEHPSLSGPSHDYELHRQQTGFVPGAVANTMAVNQSNNTGYQDFGSINYFAALSAEHDAFDFNAPPSQLNMDLDFEPSSITSQALRTVNPSNIQRASSNIQPEPPIAISSNAVANSSSGVGRLWPGAHSQAALAKAQAQAQALQRQRQATIPQPELQQPQLPPHIDRQQRPRGKAAQPADPIVEQKITQLLNSMRARPSPPDADDDHALANLPRSKKEDDEMDEDERLLASEEGKKLSSKERRQLRNKVSARAFRSRRKEYITQLEAEIANKVNENGDLRNQNRHLLEENKRLVELTRMLLSSSSFSNFLDHLSTNPAAPQAIPAKIEAQQQLPQQSATSTERAQIPKDVNPYASASSSQQQIGMVMVPEQAADARALGFDSAAHTFRPQVFRAQIPDISMSPALALLSGKERNNPIVETSLMPEKKVEPFIIEPTHGSLHGSECACEGPTDPEFESDPDFALFHCETGLDPVPSPAETDIFGSVAPSKILARYELLDATEPGYAALAAMDRVQQISNAIEPVVSRLDILTRHL